MLIFCFSNSHLQKLSLLFQSIQGLYTFYISPDPARPQRRGLRHYIFSIDPRIRIFPLQRHSFDRSWGLQQSFSCIGPHLLRYTSPSYTDFTYRLLSHMIIVPAITSFPTERIPLSPFLFCHSLMDYPLSHM